ncbi:hypothetical protein LI328DRAFT_123633 [Trichoderma asperelloides]|nr:hypothetical protein LI328DRAFT_123633 [Trichoderma asperelloides]
MHHTTAIWNGSAPKARRTTRAACSAPFFFPIQHTAFNIGYVNTQGPLFYFFLHLAGETLHATNSKYDTTIQCMNRKEIPRIKLKTGEDDSHYQSSTWLGLGVWSFFFLNEMCFCLFCR